MGEKLSSGGRDFPESWPGLYTGQLGKTNCTLELAPNSAGELCGYLRGGEKHLRVYGIVPEHEGAVRGLLGEPGDSAVIAIFRASIQDNGLLLEMDVPGEEDFSEAETVWLLRL